MGVVKLSPEVLREMLQQLAVPKVDQQQGWEFKLPTDFDFAIKYVTITTLIYNISIQCSLEIAPALLMMHM